MKSRLEEIGLSGIRAFAQEYKDKEDMIFLTIGEPNLDTPQIIKDAVMEALNENITHYPPALGDPLLREVVAEYESSFYDEGIESQQVVIVNGATEGLFLAFGSLLDEGDEVIIPVPSFPLYQTQVKLMGAEPVLMDISHDDFQIKEDTLRPLMNDKVKCLVFASPNNPTGTIYDVRSFESLLNVMKDFPDVYLIVDEVYRSMVYDGNYVSIREYESLRNRIILVTSFSKSHAMTGWRVGYVVSPMNLIEPMHKLHQNVVTGISAFSQRASIKAFDVDPDVMVRDYRNRRSFVLASLDRMGLSYPYPKGAFYVFVDISEFNSDSIAFSRKLAEEASLVVVPGVYFGLDGFIRISYGDDLGTLDKGLRRLESFIISLREVGNLEIS